jgi:hypothetical protein
MLLGLTQALEQLADAWRGAPPKAGRLLSVLVSIRDLSAAVVPPELLTKCCSSSSGGHVEPMEDPWDTVLRECREELHTEAVPSTFSGRWPLSGSAAER